MISRFLFFCFIATHCVHAQGGGESSTKMIDSPPANLPSVRLAFSEPKLDSPLTLPYTIMNGAPLCGPEGRAFLQFMTSPPRYNVRVVESISPSGKLVSFPIDRIVGLTNPSIASIDPGLSTVVMLLRATTMGQSRPATYMALFNYDGESRTYAKLDLGLDVKSVSQLSDNSFLVVGADRGEARARFMLVDSGGTLQRELGANSIMPSDSELKTMLGGMNFVGMSPASLPPEARIGATLSLFRPIHSNNGLLTLEPGEGATVVEILRSGEIQKTKLRLPVNQIADSMIVAKGSWFVRAFLRGSDNQENLYEVDPSTGAAVRRIDTVGVPPSSIACPNESGFYGLRWIDSKPYLIFGEMR
jgi:hypothetical protein